MCGQLGLWVKQVQQEIHRSVFAIVVVIPVRKEALVALALQ